MPGVKYRNAIITPRQAPLTGSGTPNRLPISTNDEQPDNRARAECRGRDQGGDRIPPQPPDRQAHRARKHRDHDERQRVENWHGAESSVVSFEF
jgi:hypothetical protein